MNVSIIGSGYVGLVTGARLAHFGVNVLCMDNDVDRIAQLEKGEVPFYEPGLMELVSKTMSAGRLSFTSNLHCAVTRSLVIIIAVDTPQKQDGSADLQYVESVCRQIGYYLDEYKLIVTKSTVPVGMWERVRDLVAQHSKNIVPFDVAANPEFLREGAALQDFMHPDRIIIGTGSTSAAAIMRDLYRPLEFFGTPILFTDVRSAERIKNASSAPDAAVTAQCPNESGLAGDPLALATQTRSAINDPFKAL